jgi:glutaminyl-peptide cyclotransferase
MRYTLNFPSKIFGGVCTWLLVSISISASPADQFVLEGTVPVKELKTEVKAVFPHDPQAFTQGLLFYQGKFYESTGLYGKSSLRRVDPTTSIVELKHDVSSEFFAEGLTLVDDRLIQLTWKKGVAFVYNREDFSSIDEFSYEGEGWGLCYDGEHLIMSDGSSNLSFRDPKTFDLIGILAVTDEGRAVPRLNELEFIEGFVYANIWQTKRIVQINPDNGKVMARVDASGLLTPQEEQSADVLNGIAWDAEKKQIWITGKNWPKIFQVEFIEINAPEKIENEATQAPKEQILECQ